MENLLNGIKQICRVLRQIPATTAKTATIRGELTEGEN